MERTRQITTFNWVTADGYFSGPDGNLDWVVPAEEQAKAAAQGMAGIDTFLFGRRTYEIFEKFWPRALQDSDEAGAPDPHHPERKSPENRLIAVALNELEKIVFSRTRQDVSSWNNSRIVGELDPAEIQALKRRPGKGIMIFGSGSIVSQLTEHGLIDHYQFVVCPVLIGSGKSLLSRAFERVKLELVRTEKYRSGDVLLHYARRDGGST